jgi:dTMP kinase
MSRSSNTGLLISFDGLDSSGKATQSQRLVERLRFAGFTASLFRSPDYSTASGQDLKERLQNKKGDWNALPWEEKMALFAANRAEHKQEVAAALQRGEMVVYDRYVPSSLAFIAVEALNHHMTELYRPQVHGAVKKREYTLNGMPVEDVSIFLDVPAVITCGLLHKRKEDGGHDDEYTDELNVQERLYNEYDWLCASDPKHYLRIQCTEGDELLLVDDITEAVWTALLEKFPILKSRS